MMQKMSLNGEGKDTNGSETLQEEEENKDKDVRVSKAQKRRDKKAEKG